jgi:hypothetical protein
MSDQLLRMTQSSPKLSPPYSPLSLLKESASSPFIIFPDDDPNLSVEKTHVICGYPTIQPILYNAEILPFRTHICIAANKFAIHYAVYIWEARLVPCIICGVSSETHKSPRQGGKGRPASV